MTDDTLPNDRDEIQLPDNVERGNRLLKKRNVPNSFMSEAEWRQVKQVGFMATGRLAEIILSADFHKLPIRDRLLAIKIAQDAAHKPMVDEPEKANVTINMPGATDESNALKTLSGRAVLPEMKKPTSTTH